MPAARKAALKAIELGPHLAEAHASLADIRFHFDRDWEGADLEYRRAIQCDPGYALSYHWYANLLAAKGHHEAAEIAILRALEIDPVCQITLVWAGVTAHLARRFDEAVQYYQNALELDPSFVWAHMYLAQALEQKGDYKGAVREFENTIKLAGASQSALAMKAHAHALAGDTSSARQILRGLKSSAPHACIPSYDIAATHAALGETKQMGFWLNDSRNKNPQQITVHLTAPPNNPSVWLVERQQTFERQNPMSQQALLSALRDKYGQETVSQPRGGWLYVFWFFDPQGKALRAADAALTGCVGSDYLSFNAIGLPPRALTEKEKACYRGFFAVTAMLNRSGNDLLESYDVQLTNLPYAYQAALKVTNARDASANQTAKEQLERGNQNKPKF